MVFSLQITRKLSSSSYLLTRRFPRGANPGINHQINAIEDAAKVIQSDPEGFDGLESDLFNAHKSHKKHELDIKLQKQKIKQCIIKNKYFRKDPLPNLLTYAEKEHIKVLHSNDEEEWTVEKLAESFPANTEVIRKILKANWSPLSPKRILSHDENVSKNWERFKNGEYAATMTTELYEHLKKFTGRRPNDSKIVQDTTQSFPKRLWKRPNSNEFSSIISLLKPKIFNTREMKVMLEDKRETRDMRAGGLNSDTYLLKEIKNKKPITIHELKNSHIVEASKDSMICDKNQLAANKFENVSGTGIVDVRNKSVSSKDIVTDYTEKFTSNEVVISDFDRKLYGMCETKQRIHIPRKLWRKGATFRTNDCYYDDDGEFLYKVPGMTF